MGSCPGGSSRVSFVTRPRLPTAVFPVLPVTSAAVSGSPLCLPPSHPATCIFSAEGQLHTAFLVASKHPPPFGKLAAEQGLRTRASQRTKDVYGGGDAQAQWERDSGSFGAGPFSKWSPAGQGGAHLIGQSQAWVKVAALRSMILKRRPLWLQGENQYLSKDQWLQDVPPDPRLCSMHSRYRAELHAYSWAPVPLLPLTSLEEI